MSRKTLDDGYALLFEQEAKWLAAGRRPIGWKVGLTSAAAQGFFGTDRPCFGRLFDDMGLSNGDTAAPGRFQRPRVEAEIAFRVGGESTQEGSIAEAVLPAIEIVQSRYPNGPAGIAELVADNTSGAGFVFGAELMLDADLDLASCRATVTRNGTPECEGRGDACLGNPLHSLSWLETELERHGRSLQAGDLVLAGSLIVPIEAHPGDTIEVSISSLGSVAVRFGTDE